MNLNSRNLPVFDNHYGHETLIGNWKDKRDLISMQVAIKDAAESNSRCTSTNRYATPAVEHGPEQVKFSSGPSRPAKPLSAMTLIMANATSPVELSNKICQWAHAGSSTYKTDFTHTHTEDVNGRGRPNSIPAHPLKSLNRELLLGADAGTVAVFEGQPTNTEYGLHLSNPLKELESAQEATNIEAAIVSLQHTHLCAPRAKTLYDTYQQLQEKETSRSRGTARPHRTKEVGGADNLSPLYLIDVVHPLTAFTDKEQVGKVPNISASKTSGPDSVGASNGSKETCNSEISMSKKCHEGSMLTTKRISNYGNTATNQSICFITTKMSSDKIVEDSYFQRSLPPPSFPL
ncbi:unnamed protein product [Phytomonas sp. Hart1]|nr:unnamed protein product [Phytomonas sp. Hart1]|eukprot:CCW69046.1 unnamed protein product [Phytomonas sp. isolate Hart1]